MKWQMKNQRLEKASTINDIDIPYKAISVAGHQGQNMKKRPSLLAQ